MLGDNGVFLYPTFPHLANYHLQFYYKVLNVAYFGLFNLLDMPVTACPFGLAKDGRPVGFQVHTKCFIFPIFFRITELFTYKIGNVKCDSIKCDSIILML